MTTNINEKYYGNSCEKGQRTSKNIEELTRNIKEKYRFRFRFCSVWMDHKTVMAIWCYYVENRITICKIRHWTNNIIKVVINNLVRWGTLLKKMFVGIRCSSINVTIDSRTKKENGVGNITFFKKSSKSYRIKGYTQKCCD